MGADEQAHSDHYGQAASVVDASGCELWMHPADAHMRASIEDPEARLARRFEVARQSGVPLEPLRAWSASALERGSGIARLVEPDRELVAGVVVQTDLGPWAVVETPGHAPSHVCLHQPITAYDVVPLLHGEELTQLTAGWWLPETLCYLRHLAVTGVGVAAEEGETERWALA